MSYKHKIFIFAFLIVGFLSIPQGTSAQDKIELEVKEAIALLPSNYRDSAKKFNQIGTKSIPFISKYLWNESNQNVLVKHTIKPQLVLIINEFDSSMADDVFIELLTHKNKLVKGYAISSLGVRKTTLAIPFLASLLNDEGVYLTEKSSNGYQKDILFRDTAVEALEKITGKKLLPNSDDKSKAMAWLDWFQTNKSKASVK